MLSTLAYNQEEYSDIIIFSNMKFLAYTVTHFACNTLFRCYKFYSDDLHIFVKLVPKYKPV